MNLNTKVIDGGELQITICRLSYKMQIERTALVSKFLPPLPADATTADRELHTARWNFIAFATQTCQIDGGEFEFPHSSDAPEEFERKFSAFLELDNELINLWLIGVNEISKPLVPRAQLPESMLSEAERKAETSNVSAVPSKKKSA